MDPNETLQRLREALTERLCKLSEAGTPCEYGDENHAVHEAFEALDEWLSKGGALPDDWARRDPEPNRAPSDPFA